MDWNKIQIPLSSFLFIHISSYGISASSPSTWSFVNSTIVFLLRQSSDCRSNFISNVYLLATSFNILVCCCWCCCFRSQLLSKSLWLSLLRILQFFLFLNSTTVDFLVVAVVVKMMVMVLVFVVVVVVVVIVVVFEVHFFQCCYCGSCCFQSPHLSM